MLIGTDINQFFHIDDLVNMLLPLSVHHLSLSIVPYLELKDDEKMHD